MKEKNKIKNEKVNKIKVDEEKINTLKKQLEKNEQTNLFKVYNILKEIYEIRNKYYKNYPINRLAKEDIIKDLFTAHKVRVIMSARHLTKK